MSISFKKYVDITSGVGGGTAVRRRDLIARLFTDNPLLPTKSFIEFTDLASVGAYFGTTSEEYKRASFYFGWISKNISKATKISFARYVSANSQPMIFGEVKAQPLSAYTSITAGTFAMSIGGVANTIGPMNFSGAASLAAVAAIIQTAVRTKTGTQWTAATVTYDPVRKSFNFVGGTAAAAAIIVTAGTGGTDVAAQIGWLTGAILSDGALKETITDTLNNSAEASDNFATFLFMTALTVDEHLEAGQWNKAQNVKYMYMVPVSTADATAYVAALLAIGGTGLTHKDAAAEYPEMVPMLITAATDYDARDAVQNYMFQQFPLTASVLTTAQSTVFDAQNINYYGRTQTAGQIREFYQRGVLMGLDTDPRDMNTYANEIWLKDAAGASIMELLLAVSRIPANATGRAQIRTTLQDVINQALLNGTISVGKDLNNTQKMFIASQTGDQDAWHQIQSIGYWLNVVIERRETTGGGSEYVAVYSLLYSKDDSIRKVEGNHVLI